jgi:acyl-CoA synthetase (AMP-forming)/AMP-acid ligase II
MDEASVITPDQIVPFSDLRHDCYGLRDVIDKNSEVVIKTNSALEVSAALLALNGWAEAVYVAPSEFDVQTSSTSPVYLPNLSESVKIKSKKVDSLENTVETRWIIYTSGTTGKPKPINHSFYSLTKRIKRRATDSIANWGLVYEPTKMAGIQVVVQALVAGSNLIAPDVEQSVQQKISFLIANNCNHLSATPTFWRQVLRSEQSENLRLKQITIGGEICDQKLLDSLSLKFRGVRISQVYASTELGPLFSVTDGKAGFPADLLGTEVDGKVFEIRDGLLFVGFSGEKEARREWFNTQDYVRQIGDRVYFLGRESNWVNVGGNKVWLNQVENVIRTHPNIEDALVASIPSEITGSLLTAKVVTNSTEEEFVRILRKWLSERLPRYQMPATIKIVTSIPMSVNGKVKRE